MLPIQSVLYEMLPRRNVTIRKCTIRNVTDPHTHTNMWGASIVLIFDCFFLNIEMVNTLVMYIRTLNSSNYNLRLKFSESGLRQNNKN